MFYAMQFIPNEWELFTVRAIRSSAFKSLSSACKAVEKAGHGYVKQLGTSKPVWSNVK